MQSFSDLGSDRAKEGQREDVRLGCASKMDVRMVMM